MNVKTQLVVGAIVTFVVSILICIWMAVSVPRMFYVVPACTIAGAVVWTFFAWLAHVMPFLESFSQNSGWFVNFLWTYIGKPLTYSALTSYVIIGLLGGKF